MFMFIGRDWQKADGKDVDWGKCFGRNQYSGRWGTGRPMSWDVERWAFYAVKKVPLRAFWSFPTSNYVAAAKSDMRRRFMSSFRPFYSCLACCRQFISRLRIRFFVRWFPADDSRSIREATQPKSRANWEDQSEVFVDVVQAPVGNGIMKLMDVKTVSTSNLTPTACKFVLPSFFIAYSTQVPIWISNFLLQKREQTSQSHFSPAIGISSFFYLFSVLI